jgi:hypothetical protein
MAVETIREDRDMATGKSSVRFEVEPDLKTDFEHICRIQNKTLSEVLRDLMSNHVRAHEDVLKFVKSRFDAAEKND